MIRRYWLLLTLTIFLALTLAACGGKGDKTPPAEEDGCPGRAGDCADQSAAKTEPTAAPHEGSRGCAHRRTHRSTRGDTRG